VAAKDGGFLLECLCLSAKLGAATNVLFIHGVTFAASRTAGRRVCPYHLLDIHRLQASKYRNFGRHLVNNKKTQFLD